MRPSSFGSSAVDRRDMLPLMQRCTPSLSLYLVSIVTYFLLTSDFDMIKLKKKKKIYNKKITKY